MRTSVVAQKPIYQAWGRLLELAGAAVLGAAIGCAAPSSGSAIPSEPGVPPGDASPASTTHAQGAPSPTPPPSAALGTKTPKELHAPAELARRLLVDRDIALYDRATDGTVVVESWLAEGTGEGIRVEHRTRSTVSPLVDAMPGELEEEGTDEARLELEKALGSSFFQVLERVVWTQPETPLALEPVGLEAIFEPPSRVRVEGGEHARVIELERIGDGPHQPVPMHVFIARDAPVVILGIWYDAGEAYGQGFNSYSEHRVIRLDE